MPSKFAITPQAAGYASEPGEEFIGVKLEGGMGAYRRDKIGSSHQVRVTWQFNPRQYAYWCAFFRTTIQAGALHFYLDLVLDNPAPGDRYLVHIIQGSVKVTVKGITYFVSCDLEAEPYVPDFQTDSELVDQFRDESAQRLRLVFHQGFAADFSPFSWLDTDGGLDGGTPGTVVSDADRNRRVLNQSSPTGFVSIPFFLLGGSVTSYTVMMWYKRPFNVSTDIIFTSSGNDEIRIVVDNTNIKAGHNGFQVVGGVAKNNQWSHIAVTWNSTGIMTLYQDGLIVDSANGVAAYATPSLSFDVGGDGAAGMVGRLDDVQFYNKLLSAGDIAAYYRSSVVEP